MTFEMPSSASRDFSIPRRPGGSTIAPVAMMQPWPGIRRGTDATVPIPPGLVRVIVAPCMSSGDSDPSRVLWIISSYTSRKPAKSIVSAPLITGTINVREPSLRCTSTASPRFTCSCTMRCGLPSSSPNVWPIAGVVAHRGRDRVPDQVRERDLHVAPRHLQRLVQLAPAPVERVHLEAAEAGRRGDREAVGHVARERGVPAAQGLRGDHLLGGLRRAPAAAPSPPFRSIWERTSSFTTLPPVPEPLTCSRSMPCAAATRRATGVLGVSLDAGGVAVAVPVVGVGAGSPPLSRRGGDGRGLLLGSGAVARGRLAGLDLRERLADLDGLVLLRQDLDQLSRGRRRDLGVDLVGRDLDDRLVLVDPVTLLLVPGEDGPLRHRFAHLGHRDLDGVGHVS